MSSPGLAGATSPRLREREKRGYFAKGAECQVWYPRVCLLACLLASSCLFHGVPVVHGGRRLTKDGTCATRAPETDPSSGFSRVAARSIIVPAPLGMLGCTRRCAAITAPGTETSASYKQEDGPKNRDEEGHVALPRAAPRPTRAPGPCEGVRPRLGRAKPTLFF